MNKANCWVIETGRGVVGPFETAAVAAEYLEIFINNHVGPCKILPVMPKLTLLPFQTEGEG